MFLLVGKSLLMLLTARQEFLIQLCALHFSPRFIIIAAAAAAPPGVCSQVLGC
jgi:hypothetical protein